MEIAILILVTLSLLLNIATFYLQFKNSKKEIPEKEEQEEYVLRIKPNFKNPMKNYDVCYEKNKKGLYSPIKATSKAGDNLDG